MYLTYVMLCKNNILSGAFAVPIGLWSGSYFLSSSVVSFQTKTILKNKCLFNKIFSLFDTRRYISPATS